MIHKISANQQLNAVIQHECYYSPCERKGLLALFSVCQRKMDGQDLIQKDTHYVSRRSRQ